MTEDQLSFYREQFDRCWHWIEAALESYGPTHTKADIWSLIEGGDAQMWPGKNCCAVTTINKYPTGMKELCLWLGGGDKNEIVELVPAMEAWGRDAGCVRSMISGRRGWLRALDGYREATTTMMKEI